jgi:peptidoglycan/LPS O-acetylase OafA/YrhL
MSEPQQPGLERRLALAVPSRRWLTSQRAPIPSLLGAAVTATYNSAKTDAPAADQAITPKPTLRRHFPYFDSLRAVAALMVLVYHVGLGSGITVSESWGRVIGHFNAGVAVFFVISGFLLYRPFVASRLLGKPAPATVRYAKRRALRILPGYWFALTALALFPGLPGVFTSDWWRFYGFMQVYNTANTFQGLKPAWSLCVEVSFYVLLPIYAWVMWRTQRGRPLRAQVRTELILLAVLWVSTFVNALIFTGRVGAIDPSKSLLYTLPFTFDWFALGMSLALISAALDITGSRPPIVAFIEEHPLMIWLVGGALWVLTTIPRNDPGMIHHIGSGFFGLVLVLPAVFGDGKSPHRILASAPLSWLGLISYGLFLWHQPLDEWLWANGIDTFGEGVIGFSALLLATLAIGILLGAFSYYVVEKPFHRR